MKHILITGSTDGIGQLLALKLAKEGHCVYLHGRNVDKLGNVINKIIVETNNPNVSGFIADFSDLTAVQQMSEEIIQALPQLDILINNAGIFHTANPLAASGLDVRFVVNYFAPFLLTEHLLPLLKKGENPRVINLSSAAQAPISLTALKGKEDLTAHAAYAQSKLALTMWSFDLAKQLTNENINVVAVNPGSLLNTKMVDKAYGQHWSPAEKGVDILYDLAISEKYAATTGQYFDNDKGDFSRAHDEAYDNEKITVLINATKPFIDKLR